MLYFLLVFFALLSFCLGCMDVCRIALTRSLASVNQHSAYPLCITSLLPSAFSGDEKAIWPLLKWNSACSPVIVLPFVPFPMVWVCPHISWLQTLSLRSNSQSVDPLLGLPLKVLMTLFVRGETSSSSLVYPRHHHNPFLIYSDYFATCALLERP